MEQENLDYLENICQRMKEYDEVRTDVIDFILTNDIKDANLATDLFVMAFLHKAFERNETLTENDLQTLLGPDEDDLLCTYDSINPMSIDEEKGNMDLFDLLNEIVKTFE